MVRKILFLHGFFASGACAPAIALKEYFDGKATVLAPDLPPHPQQALDLIQRVCDQERPDILVGNSNGSFLAQIAASKNNIPALLGNPHLEMTSFLIERIGTHEYKTSRADGNQQLVIDRTLIDEFAELQRHQWDYCNDTNREKYGVCLATMTVWHTSSPSSWSITNTPTTSPAATPPHPKRYANIMRRWPSVCWPCNNYHVIRGRLRPCFQGGKPQECITC